MGNKTTGATPTLGGDLRDEADNGQPDRAPVYITGRTGLAPIQDAIGQGKHG